MYIYYRIVFFKGGLKGFDWGFYLFSGGVEVVFVSYFKYVCINF